MKKAYTLILAALTAFALENASAQPKPGPGNRPPEPPKHQGKPAPKPAPKPLPPPPKPAPKPAPKPLPPPPKPAPKPLPPPPPIGDYKPGHKHYELEKPRERAFYKDWARAVNHHRYAFGAAPEKLSVYLRPHKEFELNLDDDRRDGYTWFARFDSRCVDVDLEHKNGRRFVFGRGAAFTEVEIEGKFPCDTIVELVYANRHDWDNGGHPDKVIRLYVHIE